LCEVFADQCGLNREQCEEYRDQCGLNCHQCELFDDLCGMNCYQCERADYQWDVFGDQRMVFTEQWDLRFERLRTFCPNARRFTSGAA
jgi:hypothetical protein